jgi:Flp pilus assembly protein TadG
MRKRKLRSFAHDETAAITVEFVVVMLFFITITFFVLEVALAQFWWQTAEKAAQIGARLALVSDPAVTAISSSTTNPVSSGGASGQACPANCDFNGVAGCTATIPCTWTCTGGGAGCSATAFSYIVNRMRQTYVPIKDSNVTISYSYTGLGYAGGPLTPTVTVTLSGVPLKLGFISIIGNIIGTSAAPLFQIPTMTATMTGEDLQSSSSSS